MGGFFWKINLWFFDSCAILENTLCGKSQKILLQTETCLTQQEIGNQMTLTNSTESFLFLASNILQNGINYKNRKILRILNKTDTFYRHSQIVRQKLTLVLIYFPIPPIPNPRNFGGILKIFKKSKRVSWLDSSRFYGCDICICFSTLMLKLIFAALLLIVSLLKVYVATVFNKYRLILWKKWHLV